MAIQYSDKHTDIVNLNVGGTIFVTTMRTLKSVSDTRLSGISTNSSEFIAGQNMYFFDRNPELFHSVLDFYRTGELHLPKHVCGLPLRNELEYWQISSSSISDCCVPSLFKFEDELEVTNNLRRQFETKSVEYTKEQLQASKWNRIKNVFWNVMDRPTSSRLARIYSILYMLFVMTTCVIFILSTHEYFRVPNKETVTINSTHTITAYQYLLEQHNNNPKVALLGSTDLRPSLYILDKVCAVFFILEFFIRFVVCPARIDFLKSWLNIVDLVIVFALLLTGIMEFFNDFYTSKALLWLFLIGRGVIILRLIRLFRFAKHFSGLKILYLALRASFEELGLLCLTFMITTSLFGALVFYAEFYEPTNFSNVPIAIWWAIVTLTTVGYGDYYPVTVPGYFVGALCGMCGLLLLSMPIAIIATNFNDYYNQNKIREKQINRKKDIFNKIKKLFSNKNMINVMHVDGIPAINGRPKTARLPEIEGPPNPETEPKATTATPREVNVAFKKAGAKIMASNRH
ncbi:potassium voltage-gated channel subfamily C member 3-like [Ruditapes philippinarum]|uniref:potassium voltage-gated channel subfamily C member 3-like n=1 Tax=Ruditapes philippinarum TaxID=129788 RepID=UPI00295C1538|nr:potassium voltage-gated channel subfamily C member 3-like [Ruditapes philippinarum]